MDKTLIERQNARFAIDGAITYGMRGTNKPPTADHWLMPYWEIGQKLAQLEASQAAPYVPVAQSTRDQLWQILHDFYTDKQTTATAIEKLLSLYTAQPQAAGQEQPRAKQEISVDVSTGEDDAYNRIFATLTGEVAISENGPVWLAIEDSRNFDTAAPASIQTEPLAVTDEQAKLLQLANYAFCDADQLAQCASLLLKALNKQAGLKERLNIVGLDRAAKSAALIEYEQASSEVSEFWTGVKEAAYEYEKRVGHFRSVSKDAAIPEQRNDSAIASVTE